MMLDPKDNILPIIKRELAYVMSFDPLADYEIELGADVALKIRKEQQSVFEDTRLLEEKYRINCVEPNVFKIWKCVA